MRTTFDIIVIGGGHAGAEAAWAASRMGASVALVTLDETKVGAMSCNPAIGGQAKGQMVREIDALGGLMGLATDATGIQFRMLNRSKGPAVWGPRAQCDKYKYAAEVQRLLATCPNLTIVRGEVAEIEVRDACENEGDEAHGGESPCLLSRVDDERHTAVSAIRLADGTRLSCRAAIVTTGTFLRALMHTGEAKTEGGRVGEAAARGLSGCLKALGLELGRLKTGTPPRLSAKSIDFAKFAVQAGDESPSPFSYLNEYGLKDEAGRMKDEKEGDGSALPSFPRLPQVPCYLAQTNESVHALIRANLHRAPMYSGQIQSTGPRYCPSIEDKVVRFADKTSHQIFLEPEGLDTDEIYCNGISTSLPSDVQAEVIRSIDGLEHASVLRWGYAVEYDMVWPSQIRSTLETKKVSGLFLAGQINGTSGYEEAAAQGQLAGINAAQYAARGTASFVLKRDQSYTAVLVDDLVTKPPIEPYRMFTSRAEHRLHLRGDNADLRLTAIGRELGLVDDARWSAFEHVCDTLETTTVLLRQTRLDGTTAFELLRRPDVTWQQVAARVPELGHVPPHLGFRMETAAKYEGYITRQDEAVARMAKLEDKLIPTSFDYTRVTGLRNEARSKLNEFTPRSLGQALRISGITPADVTLLAVALGR
ncbi:MAG TPA: tRNA uridine-5-carboxymethylaminomethyl(34) synthesis enzyme MnmG [Tepidisphaeraceae bacterium]|jgi:tRNA uridine 5-carboxymethylaminomethyl modification enzyme